MEKGKGIGNKPVVGNSNNAFEPVNLEIVQEMIYDTLSPARTNNNVLADTKCSKNFENSDGTAKKYAKPETGNDTETCASSCNKAPKDIEAQESESQEGYTRFLGIFLALVAAFQFSMSALIIKVLGYHPFNLGVWRFGVMTLIPIPFLVHTAVWKNESIFEGITSAKNSCRTVVLVMVQAILGANSIIFVFYGLKYLNIADSIVIGTSAPVFVTLFAFIFLGERCGVFPVITALLALIGVGIISKPPILTGAEKLNEETMVFLTFK